MLNPIHNSTIIRIHLDDTTKDLQAAQEKDSKKVAEDILRSGVWVDNRLYPASRIVYVELVKV